MKLVEIINQEKDFYEKSTEIQVEEEKEQQTLINFFLDYLNQSVNN